jgi:dUTP pyrophosphatase
MDTLKIKRLRPQAILPTRATAGSAGFDLYACLDAPITIPAGGRAAIPAGVAIAIGDPGVVALIFGRSGLGSKHGVVPANAVGVVDADYRGEIIATLANHGDVDFVIHHGDRMAQLLLVPIFTPALIECDELDETARGAGGFGSTGR